MDFGFSLGKSREVQPLQLLRRLVTRGLEVSAVDRQTHRGGDVEVQVTISKPGKLGDVEVGIVCTEHYDELETVRDTDGSTTPYRTTSSDVVHETWSPVEPGSGAKTRRFTIPPHAPFSYSGECLSFKWEVAALGHRSGRLDAEARSEFFVRP